VHHVGILYGQFMMHGQRNIKQFVVPDDDLSLGRNMLHQ